MARNAAALSPETFRFFRDLARNNRKEWMDANRERYRAAIVEPLRKLLDRLSSQALRLNPDFDVSGRTGTNFSRINRDIRFAKDKSPYRPQMYVMFPSRGADDGGQLYVGVSAEAVTIGFRIYGDTKSRLVRVTAPRATDNGRWLAQQARRLGRRYESYWYATVKGQWTQHKGWPLRPEDWKRLRGWVVRRKLKPAVASRAGFERQVGKAFRELLPLYQFTSAERWK